MPAKYLTVENLYKITFYGELKGKPVEIFPGKTAVVEPTPDILDKVSKRFLTVLSEETEEEVAAVSAKAKSKKDESKIV